VAVPTPDETLGAAPDGDGERSDGVLIALPEYEGPLDLLLHLIRKHELDVLDIPISFVTEKYLAYLDMMQDLHIDLASDYLVMAATLAHIKSKMLLPPDPNADDDEEDGVLADPRAELVKRLLEYQKYKQLAAHLGGRDALHRDVFERGSAEPAPEGEAPLATGNVFRLFDAFEQLLERAKQTADHAVFFERVSIAARIVELTERLQEFGKLRFVALFTSTEDAADEMPPRLELVTTFLAVLEMCKMRIIRIAQDSSLGEIWVEFDPQRTPGDDVAAPTAGDAGGGMNDSQPEAGTDAR
jgi:segregation and condensation protein A